MKKMSGFKKVMFSTGNRSISLPAALCKQFIIKYCLFISVLIASPVYAQINVNADTASVDVFQVNTIQIEGYSPVDKGRLESKLDEYEGRMLTIQDLREAATEIENEFALSGYNFYRVTLPPQTLKDGVVTLNIAAISIDDVVVIGNRYFSARNIKTSLPLIKSGESPNTQKIASALLLAEENPAKELRVIFVKGSQPETVNANISVNDSNPNELYVWANNAGSKSDSRARVGVQYHNRNLWGYDHQLSLSYTLSPQDTDELKQYGLNYQIPVYRTQGMVHGFYSKSNADNGRVADVFDVSGAGETWGVGYTQYLRKRQLYQHRLKLSLTDKFFDSDILFNSNDIGADVRARPIALDYIARFDYENWVVSANLTYSKNTSGGSFNDDQSYEAAQAGATSSWDKQELYASVDYMFNRYWRSNFVLFAQNSSDVLIGGEKFGMGGALGDFGPRGFYEREVSVDKGTKASLSFYRSFPTKRLELGVFYDYASGDRTNPQVGESPSEDLSSIGLTARWNVRSNMILEANYGYVLDGVNQEFNSEATDDGDSRFHLSFKYFPKWPFGEKE